MTAVTTEHERLERLAALEAEATALRATLTPVDPALVPTSEAVAPAAAAPLKLSRPITIDRSKVVMGHMKLMRQIVTASRALNAANQGGDAGAIADAQAHLASYTDDLMDFMSAIVVDFDRMPVQEFWLIAAEVDRQINQAPSPN